MLEDYKGALDNYSKAIVVCSDRPFCPFCCFHRATFKEVLKEYRSALNECNLGILKAENNDNFRKTIDELLELSTFLMIMIKLETIE
jgi:hypothetical protein